MSDLLNKGNDSSFVGDQENIRRQHNEKIEASKQLLSEWIEDNRRPGDGGTIIIALLELGIERHLDRGFDEKSAADLIQGVLRKVARRRLGPLQ
jgi:hypothetical protein